MDHACVASYVKCTWKSKCLVKSCCFFWWTVLIHVLSTCCAISHWRCRPRRKFPRSTVTEKWRYVKSRKPRKSRSKTSRKTCRQGYRGYPTISPYEGMVHPITLSTCLVSLSPDFLLVHFAGCLEGKHRSQHWAGTMSKRKKPECQECFCSARWIGHQSWEF